MTVNVLDAIGYANEKLHSGMIGFLCELYNTGMQEPLRSFFTALDPSIVFENGAEVEAVKEYSSLDIVLLKNKKVYIGIEMKVDSHEHSRQTCKYHERLHGSGVQYFLYFTLGVGEYYSKPDCEDFLWVRLEDCLTAIRSIITPDTMIQQWQSLLLREASYRELCGKYPYDSFRMQVGGQRGSRLRMYDASGYNLTVLWGIKGILAQRIETKEIWMTVYPSGTAPDTILNFDTNDDGAYLEITSSGCLHLKLNLPAGCDIEAEVSKTRNKYAFIDRVAGKIDQRETRGAGYKTCTIQKYNVGLERDQSGHLSFQKGYDMGKTADLLAQILPPFVVLDHT
ncbi:MAG: PD-(D/E)XK nuclease family protein [Armatimonadota bacterium]